jgi:hypothetical protein
MITTAKMFVKSVKSDIENRSAIARKLTDIYSVDDQSQSPAEIAGTVLNCKPRFIFPLGDHVQTPHPKPCNF